MRRQLIVLAAAGLLGVFAASDAQACHKKKCAAPATCAQPVQCVVVEQPCPPPAPAPCPPPAKKCHFKLPKPKFNLCHKKPACAPAPTCAPVVYEAAPVYAAPQASAQASPQVYGSGQ